jgi:hypothetical protein
MWRATFREHKDWSTTRTAARRSWAATVNGEAAAVMRKRREKRERRKKPHAGSN